jgi:hypothetical protein
MLFFFLGILTLYDCKFTHRFLGRPKKLDAESWDFLAGNCQTDLDGNEYPKGPLNHLSEWSRLLVRYLAERWPQHTVADAFGEQVQPSQKEKKTSEKEKENAEQPAMPDWVEKAEDVVAIQVITFLSQYFVLLRTMAQSMVIMSVLLFLAATLYPFEPELPILYSLLGLVLLVTVDILVVLVKVNRNEIVSRITQTTPHKFDLNWSFVVATLQVIAPTAIVVAAHMSGRLRTLLDPLIDMIR